MSFQDVGKPGTKRTTTKLNTAAPIPEKSLASGSGVDGFGQISDGILQYQRNVGILQKIMNQVGTKTDGPVLETQYKVQVDVLQQLGGKLEGQLRVQEGRLQSVGRTDAAKLRATHIKLTRDFKTVEVTFKNIQSEYRRRRARVADQQNQAEQQQQSKVPEDVDEAQVAMQLQMQQDRMNEEIMREREEEIRSINRGMHTVNEIYKDLAHIVGSQQEQVDQVETQMEETKVRTEDGLKHIQKANEKAAASQCTIS
jgi:t-SNARE complex subunit (syntaxin)